MSSTVLLCHSALRVSDTQTLLHCRRVSGIQEISGIVGTNATDLKEAMAAGVLALTSAEHRLGALRTAMISIQR